MKTPTQSIRTFRRRARKQPALADGTPSWAAVAWQEFKAILLSSPDDWEVWTDWYEARLAGGASAQPLNEELEVARTTIPDAIWRLGPSDVNAEIKRLIEEHSSLGTPQAHASDIASRKQPRFEPILATRAALRLLPLLATDTERIGDANKSRFALSVFHSLAAAWARTKFSALVGPELCVAAGRNVSAYAELSALAPRLVGTAAAEAAFSAGAESPRVAGSRASVALARAKGAIAAIGRDAAWRPSSNKPTQATRQTLSPASDPTS